MGGTVVFKGQAELSAALMRKAGLDAVKTVVRANANKASAMDKTAGTNRYWYAIPISIDLQIKDGGLCLPWCSRIPNMQPMLSLAHGKWRRNHMLNQRSTRLKPSSSQICRN